MNDQTKVNDLTVGELKAIIRALIQESSYQVIGIDPVMLKNKLPVYPDTKTTIYCNEKGSTKC